MTDEVSFALGDHSARLNNMEKRIVEIQETQHEDGAKLDKVVAYIERQRGSVGAIVGMSTFVSGAVGFLIAWFKK